MPPMDESAKHETVLDTGALQLGRVYAQALINAAEKDGVADEVINQLGEIVDTTLSEHPRLVAAFASPRVDHDEKSRVIDRLFGGKVHATLLRFLKVTAGRGRLGQLREIRHAADSMRNEMMGRVVAEVRSAIAMSDNLRTEVQQQLAQKFGKEVVLKETVDPSLIGGLVVRVGDTVMDTSVAGRLDNLSRRARDGFARRLMEGAESFVSES